MAALGSAAKIPQGCSCFEQAPGMVALESAVMVPRGCSCFEQPQAWLRSERGHDSPRMLLVL
jgi:hypothetical protein